MVSNVVPNGNRDDDDRPSFGETWMAMAEVISRRATCRRRQVGAVIVTPDNHPIAMGYNGSPHGLPHCTEVGCLLDVAGHCRRCVHAEKNAILQAATSGVSIAGGTVYVTAYPCPDCMLVLLNSGLHRVVYRDDYIYPMELNDEIQHMIEASPLEIVRMEVADAGKR